MADYYVRTDGSNSNDGSANDSAHAWLTIEYGARTAGAGDTVWVNDGVYQRDNSELVYLRTSDGGGTSGNPLTIRAINKWGAKLDGNGLCGHGFYLEPDWVVIRDFDIYGMADHYIAGCDGIANHGANNRIIGCKIRNIGNYSSTSVNGFCGVYTTGASAIIEQCVFHNIGRTAGSDFYHDHPIYHDGGNGNIYRNNLFYDNTSGWQIHVYPDDVSNLKILNNTFAGHSAQSGKLGQILLWANISTADISNNISYDPETGFVNYEDGGPTKTMTSVTVRNNLIYNGISHAYTPLHSGVTETDNIENTDPLFTDYANRILTVQSSSQARNGGITLADVTDDYSGVARPQGSAYDIGAYESSESGWHGNLLALLLTATSIPNVATNSSSSPITSLYISLHTASPGETGNQSTNECAYGGYVRVTTSRSSSAWEVSGQTASNVNGVTFAKCSSGLEVASYFGVGGSYSGAGNLYYYGQLTSNMTIGMGDTPYLPADVLTIEEE